MTKPVSEDNQQAQTNEQPVRQFKMDKRVETKDDGRLLIYYEFVAVDSSSSSGEDK